jgi:uncharacterized protein (TIGR03067 family)
MTERQGEPVPGERGVSTPCSTNQQGADAPRSPECRSRRLLFIVVLGIIGFAVWYFAIHEHEPRNDMERFQGDWQIAVAGRDTPNVVRVEADRWQSVANAMEGKAYRLSVNEAADPREIDLDPLDAAKLIGPAPRLHGIYEFESDKLARVRLNPATLPRPKTFGEPDAVVWVLTKVKLQPTSSKE